MSRLIKYISLIAVLELILCLGISTQVSAAAVISLNPTVGKVKDSVLITGSGFTPYESVTINFQGNDVNDTTINADSLGGISYSLVIPVSTAGRHLITAKNITATNISQQYFTVQPSLILSTTSGEPGTSISVSGNGFGASEAGVVIRFNDPNSTTVGTIPVIDTYGSFSSSVTFSVPALLAGVYSITATGNNNIPSVPANFTVIVTPRIFINPTSGPIGTPVTVSGSGFAPNESNVNVTIGGASHSYPASVTSQGIWSASFVIPIMPGGRYAVDAGGSTTNASNVADQSFQITPTVTVSPAASPPGSSITVEGNGFGASESVTISYDNVDVQSGISADVNGTWSKSITVPAGSSGTHKIFARGTLTPKAPPNGLDFKVGAGISINKTTGLVGTVITVTGSGFAAKETGINIIFDGTKTPVSSAASDSGGWTANFTIPSAVGGEHKIDAEGKTTLATSISDVNFTVLPQILMDKTEGIVGSSLSLTATGFAAGESGIGITYDGKPLGPKFPADTKGTWKATVTIPPSAFGTHILQVTGSVTDASQQSNLSYTVNPNMSISPTDGFIGSTVSVTGSGFTANSSLRFTFDSTDLSAGLTTTDSLGSFSKNITIPKAVGGSHTIRVQDSQSHTFEAVFNMDTNPPSLPKIISPAAGQTIGLFGDITPTLEWGKVTDPSGVTYDLQLDTDSEFGNPIIDVNGLTVTRYTIKKADALPRGQYYWRVRAVDGANNVSDWTSPTLLVSGKIAPAVFILIIIGIVAVLGVGVFFLIRFLKKRKNASQPQVAPEIVIPEVVNAEYKQIEGDKKALPWRLALPQAPQAARGAKSSISSEDQARLKVIIDFAKSVPLAEPGANTKWLVDLAENTTGACASPALYSQLVRGELQLRYEPAWMNHPTYMDLQTLLEGQPILQDLNTFIDTVNRTASEAEAALGDIYQQIATEVRWDIFPNGGWVYISAVYMDSYNWFQGKYLKEPSERDYSIKAEPLAADGDGFGLYAEPNTPFAGLLIQVGEEKEANSLRTLHLKLRRDFRNSDRIKVVVTSIIQLEVQRNRLINAFSQFNRLNPIQ